MKIIEELKQLNINTAVLISVFFMAFVAPGFLTIYKFKPDLIEKLDVLKLTLFSISITSPCFMFLFSTTVIAEKVLTQMNFLEKDKLGGYKDWFLMHGLSNTSIFYLALLLTYIFDFTIKSFILIILFLFIAYIAFEIFRVTKLARNMDFDPSLLKKDD